MFLKKNCWRVADCLFGIYHISVLFMISHWLDIYTYSSFTKTLIVVALQSKGVLYKTSARFSDSNSSESIEFFNFFRYISFRFVSIGFVSLCLISFRFFRYISFRFVTFRFVSIGFVSLRSVSFRFVSFGFVSFRSVSLHFCFVSHFTGTRFWYVLMHLLRNILFPKASSVQ